MNEIFSSFFIFYFLKASRKNKGKKKKKVRREGGAHCAHWVKAELRDRFEKTKLEVVISRLITIIIIIF